MHCTSSNFTKYVIRVKLGLVAHHLRIVGVAGARGRFLEQALEAIQVGLCKDDEVVDARVESRLDFGGLFLVLQETHLAYSPIWKIAAERS